MTPAGQKLLLVVGSQAAWFACILGAAHGWPWAGVLATAAWVGVWGAERRQWRSDLGFLAVVGLVGWLVDSLLVTGRALDFPPQAHLFGPSPLWMAALWVGFGTTLRAIGPWLRSPIVAALVGAVAGPVAYNGGVELGAARLGEDAWASRLAISIAWCVAMPLLVWWEARTSPVAG